jgi:hypothetical protein
LALSPGRTARIPGVRFKAQGVSRTKLTTAPLRKNLNMVVEAPSGDFVPFGEMCYDAPNRFGYVEPVATDADYRSVAWAVRQSSKASGVAQNRVRPSRTSGPTCVFSGARLQTVVHEQLPV